MPFDDELPQPPTAEQTAGDGANVAANFDGGFDASLLGDVPKLNDPIPAGTYEFRADKYIKKLDKDGHPRYDLQWKCQTEPHTGRVVFDFISWCSSETFAAAANPNSPGRGEAKELINKRLPRAKAIMDAAGFKPVGKTDFDEFLNQQPVVRLQLTVAERKGKDAQGKYTIPTGDMQNNIQNYMSLTRPA